MPNNPEFDKFSPSVESGVFNSGDKFDINNSLISQSNLPTITTLEATNSIYTNKIVLSWVPPQFSNVYYIYRDSDIIKTEKIENLLIDTNNKLVYEDTTATPGAIYTYRIRYDYDGFISDQSNNDTGSIKLTPPATVTASDGTYRTHVLLNWSSVTGATSYKIYRIGNISDSEGNLNPNIPILITTVNTTNYQDTEIEFGIKRTYHIVSSAGFEESDSDYSSAVIGSKSTTLDSPILTASNGNYLDKVVLSWSSVNNSIKYEIYRDDIKINEIALQNYSDTSAVPGKLHKYDVVATNSYGKSIIDTNSSEFGIRKLSPPICTAERNVSEEFIKISWIASLGEVYRYEIYRTPIYNDVTSLTYVGYVNGNTFEYEDTLDTNLEYNKNFYYVVKAISTYEAGNSSISNFSVGRLKTPAPEIPTNLIVSRGNYTDKITLSWDSTLNAQSYRIFRDSVPIALVTGTTYIDSSPELIGCTSYSYTIKGINDENIEGLPSASEEGYKSLNRPTGLIATDTIRENILDATDIQITWNSVPGATSYKLYRSLENSLLTMSEIAQPSTNSYTDIIDTDLLQGVRYYYSVKAVCALSTSNFSEIDSGILDDSTSIIGEPAAPINLSVTEGLIDKITLTWSMDVTDESAPVSGYKIYRDDIQIAITDESPYDDLTAIPGTVYTYKIKAYNEYGESAFSSTDTGYIKLSIPTGLLVNNEGSSQSFIKINWDSVPGATSYTIFRGTLANSLTELITVNDSEFIDTNTDLSYDTIYFYKVRANSSEAGAQSNLSSICFGMLEPPFPDSFDLSILSGLSSDGIRLTWTESNYAYGGYTIIRDGVPIAEAPANYFKYSDSLDVISDAYPPIGWGRFSGTTPTPSTYSLVSVVDQSSIPSAFAITTNNGTKITFTADSNNGLYHLMPTSQTGEIYTASVYAVTESGTIDFVIGYDDGGKIITAKFTATTQPQRFSLTFRTSSSKTNSNIFIGNDNLSSGDIILFGAQLEKGMRANEYISTQDQVVISNSYFDTTTVPETEYTYKIRASNNTGITETSSVVGFMKNLKPEVKTITRDQTDAIILNLDTKITINSTSDSILTIYRAEVNAPGQLSGAVFNEIESLPINSTEITYTDNDLALQSGFFYYYKVKTTYNGIDSEYSDLHQNIYGEITDLPVPIDGSSYEVWCTDFDDGAWTSSATDTSTDLYTGAFHLGQGGLSYIKLEGGVPVYNTDYLYKAIVPTVALPRRTYRTYFNENGYDGKKLPPFNGLRPPNLRTYLVNDSQMSLWADFMRLIPSNRRYIKTDMWYWDISQGVFQHVNYYKNNTTDGVSYPPPGECSTGVTCSKRYLTPWLYNQAADSRAHFKSFLDLCRSKQISFSYLQNDRENFYNFHNLIIGENRGATNNTTTFYKGFSDSVRDFISQYYLDGDLNQTSAGTSCGTNCNNPDNNRFLVDARTLDAVVNDPRFYDPTATGALHPVTGRCFADDFMVEFRNLWLNDPYYKTKPIPEGLTWRDILFPLLETNAEKAITRSTTINTSANLPATMPSSLRINEARKSLFNYYVNGYRCFTGSGTTETKVNLASGCVCDGDIRYSFQINPNGPILYQSGSCSSNACGPIGSENGQLKYAITSGTGQPSSKSYYVQDGTSGTLNYSDMRQWYSTWINPTAGSDGTSNIFATGYPKLTGYSLWLAAHAFNCVLNNWIANYFNMETFADLWTPEYPEFNHAKHINYSNPFSSASESFYFQRSNNDKEFRYNLYEGKLYHGLQNYGILSNFIIPASGLTGCLPPLTGDAPNFSTKTGEDSNNGCVSASNLSNGLPPQNQFDKNLWFAANRLKTVGGYVKTPVTDPEKYTWQYYGSDADSNYDGRCGGRANIIRYPDTKLIVDDPASPNFCKWIPEIEKQSGSTVTIKKWYNELAYKVFVSVLKECRHQARSTNSFSPWFTTPDYSPKRGIWGNSYGYWAESIYHMILHSDGPMNFWNSYGWNSNRAHVQKIFDEWRNVSLNTKPIRCSNSQGDTDLPVDRLHLSDAFEKYCISGGKLQLANSVRYIWRITVPPKYFDPVTGIATLMKEPSGAASDDDLPDIITIDSKEDSSTSQNYHNSRGVWLKRNISTPPKYIPVLPQKASLIGSGEPYDPNKEFDSEEKLNKVITVSTNFDTNLTTNDNTNTTSQYSLTLDYQNSKNSIIKLVDIEDQSCSKCLDGAKKTRDDKLAIQDKALKDLTDYYLKGLHPDGTPITCYPDTPSLRCCSENKWGKFLEAFKEQLGLNLMLDLMAIILDGNIWAKAVERITAGRDVLWSISWPQDPAARAFECISNFSNEFTEGRYAWFVNVYDSTGQFLEKGLTDAGREAILRMAANATDPNGPVLGYIDEAVCVFEQGVPTPPGGGIYIPKSVVDAVKAARYTSVVVNSGTVATGWRIGQKTYTSAQIFIEAMKTISPEEWAILMKIALLNWDRILARLSAAAAKVLGTIAGSALIAALLQLLVEIDLCHAAIRRTVKAEQDRINGDPLCRDSTGKCNENKCSLDKCLGEKGKIELEYFLAVAACCEGICEKDLKEGKIKAKPKTCNPKDPTAPKDPRQVGPKNKPVIVPMGPGMR